MGMFDDLQCHMPLPDGFDRTAFQTKDLECALDKYRITAGGQLELLMADLEKVGDPKQHPFFDNWTDWQEVRRVNERWVPQNFHGDLFFYNSDERDNSWHEYRARFTEGRVTSLQTWPLRTPPDEGVAITPAADGEVRDGEAAERPNPNGRDAA